VRFLPNYLAMAAIDRNYIYSIGRVKELEKGLLTAANLDRVLESDDPLAVLRSLGFFRTAEEHEGVEHIDVMFRREREYNRTQLRELVMGSPVEDVFRLPYDINNLKLLLKAKLSGNTALKDAALEEGKFSRTELVQAVYESGPTNLPAALREDIQWLTEAFPENPRFALIDIRLDRRLCLLQLACARAAKSRFMVEYLQRRSDLQNTTSTIRRKVHLLGRDTLSDVLLDTGTLPPSFFERLFDLSWESIATALKTSEYGQALEQALEQVEQRNFLAQLDFWCSGYMIAFLQKTKQFAFGIEPVLAYYVAREHELRVVRTIVVGNVFHYPLERLKVRMKELYY
jgi:V/A-type H+/Na+-transporting ATPase subunit C